MIRRISNAITVIGVIVGSLDIVAATAYWYAGKAAESKTFASLGLLLLGLAAATKWLDSLTTQEK
jgi:hypothetical protein